jgi:hypothetical protein
MRYHLVQEHDIEHKNEYFEIRFQGDNARESLFFVSDEENLEDVAGQIVVQHAQSHKKWVLIPHRKKHF